MREQCLPIFRQARRDVREAGMPELAGEGDASSSPERERDKERAPSRRRSFDTRSRHSRHSSTDSDKTTGKVKNIFCLIKKC